MKNSSIMERSTDAAIITLARRRDATTMVRHTCTAKLSLRALALLVLARLTVWLHAKMFSAPLPSQHAQMVTSQLKFEENAAQHMSVAVLALDLLASVSLPSIQHPSRLPLFAQK